MRRQLRPGLRTLKTGLAVFVAFFICDFFGIDNVLLVSVTAGLGIQPSLRGSLKNVRHEVLAAIFGCLVGGIFALYFPGNYLLISLGIIFVLTLTNILRVQDSFSVILFSMLIISTTATVEGPVVILQRIFLILLGQTIALVVNFLIPPRYEKKLLLALDSLRLTYEEFFYTCLAGLRNEEPLDRGELFKTNVKIREMLPEVRRLYLFSSESSRAGAKDEIYVLWQRSINALASNLERLLEIEHNIAYAPYVKELRDALHTYLAYVLDFHRKTYERIIYGEEFEDLLYVRITDYEKELEKELLAILKGTDNLEALQYYNIFAEGRRILRKCWSLQRKEIIAVRVPVLTKKE